MFANKLPKGGNCFICNENKIVGLAGLPQGGHIVAAPYMTVKEQGSPRDDALGNRKPRQCARRKPTAAST